MCAYNKVNGTYCSEHYELLTDILKKEWGFDGTVGPDFPDAQRSIIPAFLAGLDTGTMAPAPGRGGAPGSFPGQKSLRQGVDDGEVPMSRVDEDRSSRADPGASESDALADELRGLRDVAPPASLVARVMAFCIDSSCSNSATRLRKSAC